MTELKTSKEALLQEINDEKSGWQEPTKTTKIELLPLTTAMMLANWTRAIKQESAKKRTQDPTI